MSWRVLATARHFDLSPEPRQYLEENGCEFVESPYGSEMSDGDAREEELIELLEGVDAAIVGSCKLSREVIEAARSLKVIVSRGVGYDNVDLEAATANSIVLAITPGAIDAAVADHVFALMLAAAKRIIACHECVVEQRWQAYIGTEISGKTLGIVGLGRIGKAVARRAQGFDMRVLAYDVVEDLEAVKRYGVRYVPLDELLREADVVSVNAPLTEDTFHLIDATRLQMLKPSAMLINTARGSLIDEAALIRALQERRISAAGLDTFEMEPPGKTLLAQLDNVVLSPHTAGYTRESMGRANLMAAQHVVGLLGGVLPEPEAIVNPEARDLGVWALKSEALLDGARPPRAGSRRVGAD